MLKEVVWEDRTAQPQMLYGDANSVVEVERMSLLGLVDRFGTR